MRQILRSAAVRLWLPAIAAAAAMATADWRADAGDLLYFVHRGDRLLSGNWRTVYAQPQLQSGPLQLLLAGAARSTHVLAFLVEVGLVLLLVFVLGRLGVSGKWRALAAVAAVATGFTHAAFVEGHPAEAVTPLLWVLAAVDARRGRTGRAGVFLGVSAGLELWGALGAPVLLLAPKIRGALRGFVVAAAAIAVQLAPFVVVGEFRMFDYRWRVGSGTLLSLFVSPGTSFGWPLRVAQAVVACGVGALLAVRLRSNEHAVWLIPFSVALTRILLDPLAFGWYWLEVEASMLVGGTLVAGRVLSKGLTRGRVDERAAGSQAPTSGGTS